MTVKPDSHRLICLQNNYSTHGKWSDIISHITEPHTHINVSRGLRHSYTLCTDSAESCSVNVLRNKCFPSSTAKQEVVITSGRVIPLLSSHSSLSKHMLSVYCYVHTRIHSHHNIKTSVLSVHLYAGFLLMYSMHFARKNKSQNCLFLL